ncbi:MAG: cysteine synthase A [Treponemataceae bacterium]
MKIANNVLDLIGNTPLLKAENFSKFYKAKTTIFTKLDYLNPAGSAKDRIAKAMILDAINKGILTKQSVIIEPTSGNTGIGLASVAASLGIKTIFVMPENMSEERQKLLKLYGAQIVLTPKEKGMAGAVEKAYEIAQGIESSFIPAQFENPINPQTHFETTGPEIWNDTNGNIDIFIATVGTGGTLSGTGKFLKQQNSSIQIIAVEPESSPLLSSGKTGIHKIQGIGANFIPKTLDTKIYDSIITVSDQEAFEYSKNFAKTEGILVGISSGAALCAAIKLAIQSKNQEKKIVAFLADTGDRYLSVL